MEITLVKVESLKDELEAGSKEIFYDRYPGAFLLAMGFLAVEEIRAVRRSSKAGDKGEPTAAYFFGPRMRHDLEQDHPLAGSAFYLRPTGDRPHVLIGRSDSCDLTVPESSVSERHCRIEVGADGVFVVDLGSTNGTTVNLERLDPEEPTLLADEDILTVGRYSFQMLSPRALVVELYLMLALEKRSERLQKDEG
jgi:hypothetical protein